MSEDTKVAAFWLSYIAVALVALGYFVGTFAAKGPIAVILEWALRPSGPPLVSSGWGCGCHDP